MGRRPGSVDGLGKLGMSLNYKLEIIIFSLAHHTQWPQATTKTIYFVHSPGEPSEDANQEGGPGPQCLDPGAQHSWHARLQLATFKLERQNKGKPRKQSMVCVYHIAWIPKSREPKPPNGASATSGNLISFKDNIKEKRCFWTPGSSKSWPDWQIFQQEASKIDANLNESPWWLCRGLCLLCNIFHCYV